MGKADPNCWWLLIWELVTSMDYIFFFLVFSATLQRGFVPEKAGYLVWLVSDKSQDSHMSSDSFLVRGLPCLSAVLSAVMLPSGPWDPRTELLGRGQGGFFGSFPSKVTGLHPLPERCGEGMCSSCPSLCPGQVSTPTIGG